MRAAIGDLQGPIAWNSLPKSLSHSAPNNQAHPPRGRYRGNSGGRQHHLPSIPGRGPHVITSVAGPRRNPCNGSDPNNSEDAETNRLRRTEPQGTIDGQPVRAPHALPTLRIRGFAWGRVGLTNRHDQGAPDWLFGRRDALGPNRRGP